MKHSFVVARHKLRRAARFVLVSIIFIGAASLSADFADAHPKVTVEISFVWTEIGAASLIDDGTLLFPDAPKTAGLYRFAVQSERRAGVYVGETVNLRRRFQQYRTPGARQQTNLRLNKVLVDALKSGGMVSVSIVEAAAVSNWNLTDKIHRVMLEHAAIASELAAGAKVLNEGAD